MRRMLPAVAALATARAFGLLAAPKEARRVAALHAALAWLGGDR